MTREQQTKNKDNDKGYGTFVISGAALYSIFKIKYFVFVSIHEYFVFVYGTFVISGAALYSIFKIK